jgi:hypothetical protein
MAVPEELHREMGCTRAEFLRWLPGATGQVPFYGEDGAFRVRCDAGRVEIAIEERPLRRIASIALPVLAVRFRFIGMDASQRHAFLARFDAYTQRGGG